MKVTAPNTWERSKRPALATSRRIASSIWHLANGRSWQTVLSRDQRGQPRAWMALERVEKLPQRGYNSGEKEELLPKYVQMRRSNSSQVRFCRVFSAEHWQDLLQKSRYLPQHSYATPLLH